jgi:hypothetical protein
MASGTNFHVDILGSGGTSFNHVTASALDLADLVRGMNSLFHGFLQKIGRF